MAERLINLCRQLSYIDISTLRCEIGQNGKLVRRELGYNDKLLYGFK